MIGEQIIEKQLFDLSSAAIFHLNYNPEAGYPG